MRTRLAFILHLVILAGLLFAPTAAYADPGPGGEGASAEDPNAADGLCTVRQQLALTPGCPENFGPGWISRRLTELHVPYPLPPLQILSLPSDKPLVPYPYARAVTADTPVYNSPAEYVADVGPARTLGKGFIYVSLEQAVQQSGTDFFRINKGEYVLASDLNRVKPSSFQGIALSGTPPYPFGWALNYYEPRLTPGGEWNQAAGVLGRYQVVQIFAAVHVGEYDWYLIGPDQWVEQRAVAKVTPNPPPPGVSGRWIQVNLYEQTLAAYEGSQMVYATLVSSGLRKWPTRPGLFQVWTKLELTKMSGAYTADKSDYYYLEDVPWVMYFDGQRALHGAYWHDSFGFKKSHGCVNLAPRDSQWLYNFASVGTWVWVYDPSGQTPTDIAFGGAP